MPSINTDELFKRLRNSDLSLYVSGDEIDRMDSYVHENQQVCWRLRCGKDTSYHISDQPMEMESNDLRGTVKDIYQREWKVVVSCTSAATLNDLPSIPALTVVQ